MKEKIGIFLIIVLATLCLFGCADELPEEDMVWWCSTDIVV